jgi:hypothetical protein
MNNKNFLIILLLVVPIGFAGRATSVHNQSGDFAIYLLKSDTLKTWEAIFQSLDSLTLADHPLISIDDVISYDWPNHSILLTSQGIQNIKSAVAKRGSTHSFPFVVVVGTERVYLGTMYLMPSSQAVNVVPFVDLSLFTKSEIARGSRPTSLKVERAPDIAVHDLRKHARVYQALLKRNKVKC